VGRKTAVYLEGKRLGGKNDVHGSVESVLTVFAKSQFVRFFANDRNQKLTNGQCPFTKRAKDVNTTFSTCTCTNF
jgi:hypothetical protein